MRLRMDPLAHAQGAEPHDQVPVEAAESHADSICNPSAEGPAAFRQMCRGGGLKPGMSVAADPICTTEFRLFMRRP